MLRKLSQHAREAKAIARQALLLPLDAARPVVPAGVRDGDHVVVFLHGLFASAGVLRPMRLRLAQKLATAALSYPPGPGAGSVTERLARLLDQLPQKALIQIVGHSLGGIVARHYAVTSGDERVISTVALASPFGGVRGVERLRFDGARDLHRDSDVLRGLRHTESRVPHLSVFAGDDRLTAQREEHALPGAEVHVIDGVGHNAVLFDRRAIELVERRVLSVMSRHS